jgi:hypothetical protein
MCDDALTQNRIPDEAYKILSDYQINTVALLSMLSTSTAGVCTVKIFPSLLLFASSKFTRVIYKLT